MATNSSPVDGRSQTSDNVLESILDISQLTHVIAILGKFNFPNRRWIDLGLWLGLLKITLDAIEKRYHDIDRCLMECLSKWLRKADNVVTERGPPSWNSLSAALYDIGEIEVSRQLDLEKHIVHSRALAILTAHHASLAESLCDPVRVARILFREQVVTEDVLTVVESPGQSLNEKRKVLLAALKEAVEKKYNLLQTFGLVLCKCKGGNAHLGKAILDDYEKAFPDVCNEEWLTVAEEESIPGAFKIIPGILVSGSTLTTVIPETSQAAQVITIPVPHSMSHEFSSIRASFAIMYLQVCKVIVKDPPPMTDLKRFLKSYNSDLDARLENISVLTHLLHLMLEECTLVDIEIVEAVVQEFNFKEASTFIATYKATMEEFCESVSVELCLKENLNVIKTNPPLKGETVTYVFDWEPEEWRLKDIRAILSKSSGRLVKIKCIDSEYSITVTCTFSHCLMGTLITKVVKNLELLKRSGLMRLTIGYWTIWKRQQNRDKISVEQEAIQKLIREDSTQINEVKHLKDTIEKLAETVNSKTKKVSELEQKLFSMSTDESTSVTSLASELKSSQEELPLMQKYHEAIEIEEIYSGKGQQPHSLKGDDEDTSDPIKEETAVGLTAQQVKEEEQKTATVSTDLSSEIAKKKNLQIHHLESSLKEKTELIANLRQKLTEKEATNVKLMEEMKILAKTEASLIDMPQQTSALPLTVEEAMQLPKSTHSSVAKKEFDLNEALDSVQLELESETADGEQRFSSFDSKLSGRSGDVTWGSNGVYIKSPSPQQCQEVLSKLADAHLYVNLFSSSSEIFLLLLPSLLQRKTVKEIRIYDTPLTHQSIQSLSQLLAINDSLDQLELSNTFISNEGVDLLCRSLQQNSTLTSLYLTNNPLITSDSANTLSGLLLNNSTLSYLHLQGTSLGHHGVHIILQALASNKSLQKLGLDRQYESTCYETFSHKLIEEKVDFF